MSLRSLRVSAANALRLYRGELGDKGLKGRGYGLREAKGEHRLTFDIQCTSSHNSWKKAPDGEDQAVTEGDFTPALATVNPWRGQAPEIHSAMGGTAFLCGQVRGHTPRETTAVAGAERSRPVLSARERGSSGRAVALRDPAPAFDPGAFIWALPAVVVTPSAKIVHSLPPKAQVNPHFLTPRSSTLCFAAKRPHKPSRNGG